MRKRFLSFKYALTGIANLFKEPNAKIHLFAAILVIAMGLFFKVTLTEWCLLIFAIGMVLAAEGFNTAIEKLVDLISPEIQPLAGYVKDLAAGAVLITAISAAVIGALIFGPKIWEML